MDNIKKAKVLLIWCAYYFAIVVFGGAINFAANGNISQQFGHFLESFVGSFGGLKLTLVLIVFFTALKMLKEKKRILGDEAFNLVLAVLIMWIFFGALSGFLGLICDACAFKTYTLSDYTKGSVTIACLNFLGIIALFVAVKFYKTVGGYFKSLGKNYKQNSVAEDAPGNLENNEEADADVSDVDDTAVDADKID